MNFNADKPIYLQIADTISDRILSGDLKGEDRLPSVRDYGADIGVNPNTMMRVYERLTDDEVIYNKRGIGYFITAEAREIVLENSRKEFLETELPVVIRKMELLGLNPKELFDNK